jgi:hypothetical protein
MLAASPFKARLFAVATAAALCGTTGAAYAAGLPSAASSTASAALQRLGITDAPQAAHSRPTDTHGYTISTLAKTTTATGAAKGAEISAAASNGKSHAGQHGHNAGGSDSGSGHGHSGDHPTHAGGSGHGAQ